jgi:ribulose-bisphosphate carboxylase large chain
MTLPQAHELSLPNLSGDRFHVHYLMTGSEEEARVKAGQVAVEQTVEFPVHLIPESDITRCLVGQIERFERVSEGRCAVTISYAVETAGADLPQLLTVIQGLSSLIQGVRVERVEFPDSLLRLYRGPRFGRKGWRGALQVYDRPLLCTAIKPMGLSPQQLADMAYQCALGGLDIIKDDHAITDLVFCPFEERVQRCAEAVAKANRETGLSCIYVVNVAAPADRIIERARFARQAGAGALMIAPAATGFDSMRLIADDDRIDLPIISHPTLSGNFVASVDGGFSYYAYYGQLHRLAGADAVIFVNHGGRFLVERADCEGVVEGSAVPMAHIKPIMPCPGGGMKLDRIPELRELYGNDAIFLVGGGLHSASDDLVANVRQFLQMVQ